MEYTPHEYACFMPKLKIGDAMVYGDSKMIVHEIREDGTIVWEIKCLENGKWVDYYESESYKKLKSELEERNKQTGV